MSKTRNLIAVAVLTASAAAPFVAVSAFTVTTAQAATVVAIQHNPNTHLYG